MDIEGLKKRLDDMALHIEKLQKPDSSATLTDGVSAKDVQHLWTDYNKLLKELKSYSDLFGEYRDVFPPATQALDSKFTDPITGYKFDNFKPLIRQIEALKGVIDRNYF